MVSHAQQDTIPFYQRVKFFLGVKAEENIDARSVTFDTLQDRNGNTTTEFDTTMRLEGLEFVDSDTGNFKKLYTPDTVDLMTAIPQEEFQSLNIGGYKISFNTSEGVHELETAISGVVWQGALEDLVQVYNNTGAIIENGKPLFFTGSTGDTIANVGIASANNQGALGLQGLATGNIGIDSWGFMCVRGKVRNIDASGLSTVGALYLSNDSLYTNIAPAHPSERVLLGGVIDNTDGDATIYVSVSFSLRRQLKTKSYSFTSQSISSGEYWKAGYYDVSSTDANLTQASTSITYGVSDIPYEAHPFAVYGGVGSVTGGGRVALITTGTSYNDATGVQTPNDVDTVITDITNATLNTYDETKKYLGTVTYQLVIVEGAPTAYSLDFNYGYAKYDDINDRDFYITGLECVWLGDGSDPTGMDIELYYHTQTGWTYAATGFDPGNGIIAQRSVDQTGFLRVNNLQESAWKRTSINQFIDGTGEEGFLIKVTTGSNSTIQIMDIHVEVAID